MSADVALVVIHHFVEAVIRGLVLVGGRHRVPGDAAAGDVIERIEQPRAMKRVMIGRRQRQGEADPGAAFAINGIIGVMSWRGHFAP